MVDSAADIARGLIGLHVSSPLGVMATVRWMVDEMPDTARRVALLLARTSAAPISTERMRVGGLVTFGILGTDGLISPDDVPASVATAFRMVTAYANADDDAAESLWDGYAIDASRWDKVETITNLVRVAAEMRKIDARRGRRLLGGGRR